MKNPLEVHLTSKEVAQRWRKAEGYLAQLRTQGKGPRFLPGRPILYPISEVEAWERAQLKTPALTRLTLSGCDLAATTGKLSYIASKRK